jgi:E3 ubiquitin-protein ligase DOA10
MVCRICLDYDNGIVDCADTNFNPMISPCGCSGTMGGIHLKCLREWIERNKIMKAVKGHVVIKYKKINCELCKQKYPFSITINNKIVDIINIERPKDNFIILETLSSGV